MAPNSDRLRRIRRLRRDWPSSERFGDLRRRLYRARDGKLLGVFKGIADSLGWGVCRTRVVGVFVLLILAAMMGAHGFKVTVLVAGFFYLLTALLMQPPHQASAVEDSEEAAERRQPMPMPPGRGPQYSPRPRVDLAQLDRQLDSLDRRIQQMETIVTDREYEWNRRMES